MKGLIAPILLLVLLPGSCTKDRLTEATETGAHTFSCKIDGDVFMPCRGGWFGGEPLWGHVTITGSMVTATIAAKCTERHPYKEIFITLDQFSGVGEYRLNDYNNICFYEERYPDKTFSSEYTGQGKVVITKDDRINHILSGSFEFIGKEENSNQTVEVRSGRFDIKY